MPATCLAPRGASLHRYDQFKKDSSDCQHCQQVWDHMKKADEELLAKLAPHIREHLDKDEGVRKAA